MFNARYAVLPNGMQMEFPADADDETILQTVKDVAAGNTDKYEMTDLAGNPADASMLDKLSGYIDFGIDYAVEQYGQAWDSQAVAEEDLTQETAQKEARMQFWKEITDAGLEMMPILGSGIEAARAKEAFEEDRHLAGIGHSALAAMGPIMKGFQKGYTALGIVGRNTDDILAKQADDLIKKGISEEEVYLRTGLWRPTADSHWRKHYPNKKYKESIFEVKKPSPLHDDDVFGELDPQQVLDSLPEYTKALGLTADDIAGGIVLKPARDDGIRGAWNAAEKKITLFVRPKQHLHSITQGNIAYNGAGREMTSLIHELTHVGQLKGGLPGGGANVTAKWFRSKNWAGETLKRRQKAIRKGIIPRLDNDIDVAYKKVEKAIEEGASEKTITSLKRQHNNLSNQRKFLRGISDEDIKTPEELEAYTYAFYRNLMGEQDARLSQSALEWTDDYVNRVFPKGTTEMDVAGVLKTPDHILSHPVYDDFTENFIMHNYDKADKLELNKVLNTYMLEADKLADKMK